MKKLILIVILTIIIAIDSNAFTIQGSGTAFISMSEDKKVINVICNPSQEICWKFTSNGSVWTLDVGDLHWGNFIRINDQDPATINSESQLGQNIVIELE